MKKLVAILGLLLFTLLYCFATYTIISSSFVSGADKYPDSDHQIKFCPSENALLGYAAKNEISFNPFQNQSNFKVKNQVGDFYLLIKSAENTIETSFIRYIAEIRNSIFRFRKSDGIFPFQYFW